MWAGNGTVDVAGHYSSAVSKMLQVASGFHTALRRGLLVSISPFVFRDPICRATIAYQALCEQRHTLRPADASRMIASLVAGNEPCMIARFGSVELGAMLHFRKQRTRSARQKLYAYLHANELPWWSVHQRKILATNAGVFSNSPSDLDRFAELMIDAAKDVDLLGSWVPGESMFAHELTGAKICALADLEPYAHCNPWSEVLAGMRVLVIHPFVDSIRHQYELKRSALFADARVLPAFELLTIRAVQSIADNETPFRTWFDALEHMFHQTLQMDYDVAIIGCGAYGFPLASMIKRSGKKAIHLGGATQIMFGIKGKRWENHPFIRGLFNDAWIRPLESETPIGHARVEGGCYW